MLWEVYATKWPKVGCNESLTGFRMYHRSRCLNSAITGKLTAFTINPYMEICLSGTYLCILKYLLLYLIYLTHMGIAHNSI